MGLRAPEVTISCDMCDHTDEDCIDIGATESAISQQFEAAGWIRSNLSPYRQYGQGNFNILWLCKVCSKKHFPWLYETDEGQKQEETV